MNLLFIVSSLSGGGAEKVMSILTSELSSSHNVWLVLDEKKMTDYEIADDINVINLNRSKTNNPISNLKFYIRKYKTIKSIKKKNNIISTVSMMPLSNLFNVLTKQHDKVIASVRIKMSVSDYSWYIKQLDKLSCKCADEVIAVSECVKRDLINSYNIRKNKICTIYNPCFIDDINEKRKETIEPELQDRIKGKKVLITHGRLTMQKAQWHLIRAMSEIVNLNPNIILLILGEGELREYLQQLINDYKLQDNVILIGFCNNPYKYLTIADIYVFSSIYEGFPNALLDAMACKLPVISADSDSGVRELLAPSTDCEYTTSVIEYAEFGVLVPRMGNKQLQKSDTLNAAEQKLAKAIIEKLYNSKRQAHYIARAEVCLEKYKVHQIVKQWEEQIKNR